jgi:mono/diheme cytochrome c family protein
MKFGLWLILLLFNLFVPASLFAQQQPTPSQQASTKGMKLDTGEEIFKAACIGCHGPDGVGQPETILGFEPPPAFPDFTDCLGSARERRSDWSAILHEGGPIRAFSEIMPSWKEALTSEQIDKVTGYLRSLCTDSAWPVGELNFPRALFTEKAFPEDEYVLTSAINTNGSGLVSGKLVWEKRIGARNQIEVAVPYSFIERASRSWIGGIGDFVLGFKRVLVSNIDSGSIFSLQGEVKAPTGNRSLGLGSGVTSFEAFGAIGQILPASSFVQIQSGFELPTDRTRAANAFFWKTAVGRSFATRGGVGRQWTPMVEFLGDRELVSGARMNWDIVPEMQVTLNRRQHVRLAMGVRTPMTNTAGRSTQLTFYLLWDTFDGVFWEGW